MFCNWFRSRGVWKLIWPCELCERILSNATWMRIRSCYLCKCFYAHDVDDADGSRPTTRWEQDYYLEDLGSLGLFREYLSMGQCHVVFSVRVQSDSRFIEEPVNQSSSQSLTTASESETIIISEYQVLVLVTVRPRSY